MFLRGKTAASVLAAFLLLALVLPGHAVRVPNGGSAPITLKQDGVLHAKFMDGNDSGLFRPDRSTTRAELAQILFNLMEQYPVPDTVPTFPDVPLDAWFLPAVDAMTGLGIMTGGNDGLFHPNDPFPAGR